MDVWKVTLIGDAGVGKTTLAVQFTVYDPATEEGPYRKQLIVDNKMCFIEVIDTRGQDLEEYNILRDDSIREGQGFALVYSIASRTTFDRLEKFHQCIRRVHPKSPIFVLVGNKCDQAYAREVSKEEGADMARQFGCEFIETSAKTAQNVERLFINLIRSLRQSVIVAPRQKEVKKKSKCVVV